jgi:hypothetical protein
MLSEKWGDREWRKSVEGLDEGSCHKSKEKRCKWASLADTREQLHCYGVEVVEDKDREGERVKCRNRAEKDWAKAQGLECSHQKVSREGIVGLDKVHKEHGP